MDAVNRYRGIISQILGNYAEFISGHPGSEPLLVLDDAHGHYLILFAGWHGKERELRIHVYVRMVGSKFWIEEDGTEFGIAQRLVDEGVPRQDIVLAFQTPFERRLGEFAPA